VLGGLHHEYSLGSTPALPYGIRAAEPNDRNHRRAEVKCRVGRMTFLRSTARCVEHEQRKTAS
jgi:hypothetical protein